MFGYRLLDVLTHTLCVTVAANTEIAVQRRKINGVSRFAVASMNASIQDGSLRSATPVVRSSILPKAVGVSFGIIVSFVPADFTVIGDAEGSASGERDGDGEVVAEDGEDTFFVAFRVHEGQGVMILEHDDGNVHLPQVEQGSVDDVSQAALRIVGDGFFKKLLVRGALKEIAAAPGQCC